MKKIIFILMVLIFKLNFLQASELNFINNHNAVCNNGEQATFTIKKGNSNKWVIILPGGGVARNNDEYINRSQNMKEPEQKAHIFNQGIEKDLEKRDYNMVFIPYCSSDLFQGNHINLINNKEVPFKGRVIFESVIDQIYTKLKKADEIIFAGYSAGAIGIGFNAKKISEFKNVRIIVDSFWFDNETKKFYQDFEKKHDRSFLYRSSMKLCNDSWVSCFPSRENFEKNNINDVFLIWNIGDKYAKGVKDKEAIKIAIKKDIDFYNAGFSIEAEERKVSGFEDWGHVLAWDDKTYKKNYFNISLQEAVTNWMDKKSNTKVIEYFSKNEIKTKKKSNLFDGKYKFKLYRSSEENKTKIGNGKLEVKDGELFFLVKESKLKTGPKEFLKTAMISINKDGVLDGSIKLDILDGKDRSEYYHFNGKINKKIWGTSTKETFFKVYIEIKK